MNMTIDINTLLTLSGLAINLAVVVGFLMRLEHRLTKLETWKKYAHGTIQGLKVG